MYACNPTSILMCGEVGLCFEHLDTLDNGSFGFGETPIAPMDKAHEFSGIVESVNQSMESSGSSTAHSSMTLPFLGNVEESSDENCLLKPVTYPLPAIQSALDLAPTDFLSCFDSPIAEKSAEISICLSPKSSPVNDPVPLVQTATASKERMTYSKRRSGTISDICGRNVARRDTRNQNGTKRNLSSARRVPSKRQKKITKPSKFCHICVRSSEQVLLIPCANVVTSVCRKAVCQRCFHKHGMMSQWDSAVKNKSIIEQFHEGVIDTLPSGVWICPHCQSSCPPSAQCKIYAKTNRKRHLLLQKRRREREMHLRHRHEANKNAGAFERTNAYNLTGITELPHLPSVSSALPEHGDIISSMLTLPGPKLQSPYQTLSPGR